LPWTRRKLEKRFKLRQGDDVHKVTFYPLGNAETLRIDIENGRKVLIDYADKRDPNNKFDLRCDLPALLKAELKTANRDYYDAVVFTHLDDDHVCGAGDFFYFEHATSRQTEGRIKMDEMWVPAFAVLESNLDGDSLTIRKEARYRLKELKGEGIRVFSAPGTLKQWFEDNDLDIDDYRERGIVLDAGKLVPTFSLSKDKVEFFVHSPFASRTEDGTLHVRNTDAIVMQAVFQTGGQTTRFLITADVPSDQLDEIVRVTKLKKNEIRLKWDIYDVPHHCSYTGIGPEKGKNKTEPTDNVKWLHEQGEKGGVLVSSSKPIPIDDSDSQPPHRQAAAYYQDVAKNIEGVFEVTMEHPKKAAPEPLVIEISDKGAALKRATVITVGGGGLTGQAAHRVG
jgi:ribonuclease BN (tRNA processing enzyme)